jgi:hypothetical protein
MSRPARMRITSSDTFRADAVMTNSVYQIPSLKNMMLRKNNKTQIM